MSDSSTRIATRWLASTLRRAGLQDEVEARYGEKPPVAILIKIMKEHGVDAAAYKDGLRVDGEQIPADLQSVMNWLGY